MPRKATPAAEFKESKVNALVVQEGSDAQNELALLVEQHESHVRAVAEKVGYQLPSSFIDADLIQRDVAMNMRRSVEACLEVGRGLVVLKAATEHGNFMQRLDSLEIEESLARRFMQTAQKFSKRASTHVLKAAGNQTKLFEMLVLDDEQIAEFELTGQTGELTLDDVATMSVKELRKELRKIREEKSDVEKRSAAKTDRIVDLELKVDKKQVAPTDWPAAFSVLFDQAAGAAKDLSKAIDALEAVFKAGNQVEPAGEHEEASLESAKRHLAEQMQATFNKGLKDIFKAAMTFEKTLGAYADAVVYPS